jgi:hypothetical protein
MVSLLIRVDPLDLPDPFGGELDPGGDLLHRGLPAQLLGELALDPDHLVDGLHHVHRDPDGPPLVRQRSGDGLTDPPGGVGGELEALGVVELLRRPHEPQVPLLDEVQERQAPVPVPLGDGDHQPEVRLDQDFLGLLAPSDRLGQAGPLLGAQHDLAPLLSGRVLGTAEAIEDPGAALIGHDGTRTTSSTERSRSRRARWPTERGPGADKAAGARPATAAGGAVSGGAGPGGDPPGERRCGPGGVRIHQATAIGRQTPAMNTDLMEEVPGLARAVTPAGLGREPVHRWFWLAHSFSPALVRFALARFGLRSGAVVGDPFCGAGTTLVEARRLGMAAVGIDLSPLAVLASRVKCSSPDPAELRSAAAALRRREGSLGEPADAEAVGEAFEPAVAEAALRGLGLAGEGRFGETVAAALRLAVIEAAAAFALKVRKGGWLAWREAPLPKGAPELLVERAARRLEAMAEDAEGGLFGPAERGMGPVVVARGDARRLPVGDSALDAVVTSPPYPNRHDYSRAYGVELSLGLCGPGGPPRTAAPAAPLPPRGPAEAGDEVAAFEMPEAVEAVVEAARRSVDPSTRRFVPEIARGWALDMAICLGEVARVLVPGGRAAVVVGNATYEGVEYPSDLIVAELAGRAGLVVEAILVARRRAASAQQSARRVRTKRRESVVLARRRDG